MLFRSGAHGVLDQAPLGASCGADRLDGPYAPSSLPPHGGAPLEAVTPPDCLYRAQIAYDCDYEYYLGKGASVANVVATVESHTDQVNAFYARDAQITHKVTEIVVRTAPFYSPVNGGHLLDLFRAEWNTNQWSVKRDLAHLMTGKPGSLIQYGGLAWVGVVCNKAWAYGWSMDSAGIVGHEVGHNWGAGHCHDVSPCNNMCGACFYIGPNTKDIITAYRDGVGCLKSVGPFGDPLPPYAHPEGTVQRKDDLQAGTPVAFDVLGNDHDGNCEPVSIGGFDAVSARGASVTFSPGTGPNGRNELVYAPPAVPFLGADTFAYTATDPGALTGAGTVTVDVLARDLAGYWTLDDASGSVAADTSRFGRDGAITGSPAWTSGPLGGALAFDGADDSVAIGPLDLPGDEATISAWLRRDGPQSLWSAVVFSRDAGTKAGLSFGANDGLRYVWNGDAGTHGWDSGLVVPDGQWVFVALVLEPDAATLYLDDGVLQSAVHAHGHAVQTFAGTTHLGWDPLEASRHFQGELDDVRIYDHALSAAEIQTLAAQGGPALVPTPADGGTLAEPSLGLSWAAAPLAGAHDVYFGTDYFAVRDATVASPEYQGTQPGVTFVPPASDPATTYFWRVDEQIGGGDVPGDVWQYAVPRHHHWALDETQGDVAADAVGGLDGLYKQNPTLGEPGATAQTGTSVRLDGQDDRVRIPALDLFGDRMTITAWLRRDGSQTPWAGIVFSRAQSTTAGLNFGNANELRYHWNGGNWGWDSGLVVPDDEWVFTALVVEPSRATIYLGQGGTLSSAVNVAGHGIEEFDGATLVGRDNTGGSRYFDGWVDDVRIFDAALSPAEIAALYASSR